MCNLLCVVVQDTLRAGCHHRFAENYRICSLKAECHHRSVNPIYYIQLYTTVYFLTGRGGGVGWGGDEGCEGHWNTVSIPYRKGGGVGWGAGDGCEGRWNPVSIHTGRRTIMSHGYLNFYFFWWIFRASTHLSLGTFKTAVEIISVRSPNTTLVVPPSAGVTLDLKHNNSPQD